MPRDASVGELPPEKMVQEPLPDLPREPQQAPAGPSAPLPRTEGRHGVRNAPAVLLAILLALLLGAALLALFVHTAQAGIAGRLAGLISGRKETFIAAPDVVERIQRLSRLETVVYSLDTVVENRESSAVLPDMLAGDRLLMIVHGQTVAGIDLGKLRPEDVRTTDGPDGRSVHITLPASQVFLTAIDNAKTRVYARDTGLFVAADPNLESATRAKAQGELQGAALSDGILDAATRNGRETVRALLEGLGFRKVEIQ